MIKKLSIICVILFAGVAHAATYYVTQAGGGGDGGNGSNGDPWSVAEFNALSGDRSNDTFYFSGTITTGVTIGVYGTSGSPVILDGWEGGTCDPPETICSSATDINATMTIDGTNYTTIQDFDWPNIEIAFTTTSNALSTGLIIRNNTFLRSSGVNIRLFFANDSLVDNNKLDSDVTSGVGHQIEIGGGKRNVISNNWIDGGVTNIIFKYQRSVNGGGSAGILEDNIVTGNDCFTFAEEGISFDTVNSGLTSTYLERGVVSASSTHTVTLTDGGWGGGDDPDYIGFYMVFMSGSLAGKYYEIADQSDGPIFTFAETVSSAGNGDVVMIGAPFLHNYIANNNTDKNHADTILLYGFGIGNIIENNTTGSGSNSSISLRSLGDLKESDPQVVTACGHAPTMYNLVRNNTVGGDINVWILDFDGLCSCCEDAYMYWTSTGNTILNNTIGDRLYVARQNMYYSGNTGSVYTDSGVTNSTAYEYYRPYILTDPRIASDGLTVNFTFSETVEFSGYTTGDFNLDCDSDDINLSSPAGSGASWGFTTSQMILSSETCSLDFNGASGSVENSSGDDMTVVGNKIVTNNSSQSFSWAVYNASPIGSGIGIIGNLTWSNPVDTTGIDLYFQKGVTPPTTQRLSNQDVETWNYSTLDQDSTYYWQVDVIHSGGTETGTVYEFKTTIGPDPIPPTTKGAIQYRSTGTKMKSALGGFKIKR